MSSDPIAAILGGLDRPVRPRREFADELLRQLLEELEPAPRRSPRLPALPRPRLTMLPLRARIALVVLAVLLLAAVATATYLGVRTWVSSGPRGVQFTSDFRLAVIFRDQPKDVHGRFWPGFQLAGDGSAIYALRQPPPHPQRAVELVRIDGIQKGRGLHAEHVLDFSDLAERRLWDAGLDLAASVFGVAPSAEEGGKSQTLAVADDSTVFLLVGAWRKADELDFLAPPLAASLIAVHPDGSREKVLTLSELVGSGLIRGDPDLVRLKVADSAPDRLWIMAHAVKQRRNGEFGPYAFYEVVDPNSDGKWADRVIRAVDVPEVIPVADQAPQGWQRTYLTQIAAEHSGGGVDRSRSLLVAALSHDGEYRVFRLSDRGQADTVLTAEPGSGDFPPPVFAPRLVVRDGRTVVDELVAGALTRITRISRISHSGEIADVARAFAGNLEYVLADHEGNIYPVVQLPGTEDKAPSWVIYRLTPVELGAPASAAAETQATTAPAHPGQTVVPRIAFGAERYEADESEILVLRADARGGVRRLAKGRHNQGFCQSADGRRMAYFSDQEAPHEPFIYVADADGGNARKVTEKQVGFWCNFSERWLLLTVPGGAAMTLVRHDLRNDRETTLARGVDRLALSPDGNRILYVGGLDFSDGVPPGGKETLELVNMETLERRRLDGPLERGGYSVLAWSPDGNRVAYFVGSASFSQPNAGIYRLVVQDVPGGVPTTLYRHSGGPPTASWSPDGTALLVCAPVRGRTQGCTGDNQVAVEKLLRIDSATGNAEEIARGKLLFAGWAPEGGSFAYADARALRLVSPDGEVGELAHVPSKGWPAGNWLGFSPDGSYIGLGDFSSRLGVVEVATGEVRILLREKKGQLLEYRKWWR